MRIKEKHREEEAWGMLWRKRKFLWQEHPDFVAFFSSLAK
jgi:hypothetical protein